MYASRVRHFLQSRGLILATCMAMGASTVMAQSSGPSVESTAAKVESAKPPGWLGLRLVPVPQAVVAHLQRDQGKANAIYGRGVMVTNLIVGSPADRAGFQRYDVIVAIDGRPVTDELSGFVEKLAEYKAGQKLQLIAFQQGRLRTIPVTLATPPQRDANVQYKYAPTAGRVETDRVKVEGEIYQRTSDRRWVGEPITEANRAEVIARMPPDVRERIRRWASDQPAVASRVRVHQDGQVIEITRDLSGKYIVRRYHDSDRTGLNAITRTYNDIEHFMTDDPLGHRIYDSELATDQGLMDGLTLLTELEATRPSSTSVTKDDIQSDEKKATSVRREFSVIADGRIRVTITARDNVLTYEFRNEMDFRRQQPDLFRYFRQLNNALR